MINVIFRNRKANLKTKNKVLVENINRRLYLSISLDYKPNQKYLLTPECFYTRSDRYLCNGSRYKSQPEYESLGTY